MQHSNNFNDEPILKHELINAQRESPIFRDLYRYLKLDTLPTNRNLIRQVLATSEEFVMVDRTLFHISLDKLTGRLKARLVIPNPDLALRIIDKYHSSKLINHMAITSLYKILNNKYYIKNLLQIITDYVKSCVECSISKTMPAPGTSVDFHLCLTKGKCPTDVLYLDRKKMYSSKDGYNYAIVICDSFSKFIWSDSLKNRSTGEILKALLKYICQFGIPNRIHSDLEGGMTSNITKALLQFLGIEIKFCLSHAHESHGTVERAISRLIQRLQFLLSQKEENWPELLPIACLSANCIIQDTGYSAFQLMFLRPPKEIPVVESHNINFDLESSTEEYMVNLKEQFKQAQEICKEINWVNKKAQVAKHRHQIKVMRDIEEMDLVYLLGPSHCTYLDTKNPKIVMRKIGPLCVEKITAGDRTFKLRTLDNQEILPSFHSNRIEKASLLVQQIRVSNLKSLITQLNLNGIKGKEHVLHKLEMTEQAILKEVNKQKTDENALIATELLLTNTADFCMVEMDEASQKTGILKKFKWKFGELFALIQMGYNPKMCSWWRAADLSEEILDQIKNRKIPVTGSLLKYRKQLKFA